MANKYEAKEAAQRLEMIGRGRHLGAAQQALTVLENEMRRLMPVLVELGADPALAVLNPAFSSPPAGMPHASPPQSTVADHVSTDARLYRT